MENDFKSNFGMLIQQGAVHFQKPKPVSRWKKLVCLLTGHKWGFAGISYMGPSFPRKCSRCKVNKWFDKPNLRMRIDEWVNKTLDKLWVPLCKIGVHRWKSHYWYSRYTFGGDTSTPTIRQEIYKCSCCKKIKTVDKSKTPE